MLVCYVVLTFPVVTGRAVIEISKGRVETADRAETTVQGNIGDGIICKKKFPLGMIDALYHHMPHK